MVSFLETDTKNRYDKERNMVMTYIDEYNRWLNEAAGLKDELEKMTDTDIEDAFFKSLEFGTGGLRGVIGAGTNRMNIYTVGKATQGLSEYILKHGGKSCAISYDSRNMSDVFSKIAASVLAANGIKAYMYSTLMPTPCLSFAVRYTKSFAGIMVTASHNPSKYNGYKVYNADGCQITTEAADEILAEIEALDVFRDVKSMGFEEALERGLIEYIYDDCYDRFTEEVKGKSVLFGDETDKTASIVYSPLNGTGLRPVTRVLDECGFKNITLVEEQKLPDGNFPTCPYPNPEIREAMELGIRYAKDKNADLLIATDPDCDRIGIAVKDGDDFRLITGNELGLLLFDFICSQRIKHGKMPENPVLIKTIVSTDMADLIAENYGVQTVNVLTGFKYIGEQIGMLEDKGEEERYIFGFEESYGYLSGTHVRDKDAVNAALLTAEMFAYYRARKVSLTDKLQELYGKYGYFLNSLRSFEFEGASGFRKMQDIMENLRKGIDNIGGRKIVNVKDYNSGIDGLPKSNVLKYRLENGASVVVRPSGTEPKLKVYLSVKDDSRESALKTTDILSESISGYMK